MKYNYVEDLVNPKYYVYLDFDNLISYTEYENHSSQNVLRTSISILMFIAMVVCLINHWWIALTFSVLLAFFSFPKTSRWLQNLMKVTFPNKFFWIVTLFLLMSSFFSMGIHKHVDNLNAAKAAALAEQQRQTEIAKQLEQERIAKEIEQQRLDSLSYHLSMARTLFANKKAMESVQEYKLALFFSDSESKSTISYELANILYAKKQYEEALMYYKFVNNDPNRLDTLQYNKAICYVKAGILATAVSELRQSVETNRVRTLFNKINPVKTRVSYVDKPVQKKRVAYYTILCRDGSTSSSSSRRGTCSRHGGVADWDHPVYETYTENQKQKVIEKYREYGEF